MAFCMECGTRLPDGAKFCINCGTPVKNSGRQESSERTIPVSNGIINCLPINILKSIFHPNAIDAK